MASNIDVTKPEEGHATTISVRENFAAAHDEIIELQDHVDRIDQAAANETDRVDKELADEIARLEQEAATEQTRVNNQFTGEQTRVNTQFSTEQTRVNTQFSTEQTRVNTALDTKATRAGDLGGDPTDTVVTHIQTQPISQTAPSNPSADVHQVLGWSGSAWTPENVTQLQGRLIVNDTPVAGQVLTWTVGGWRPVSVPGVVPLEWGNIGGNIVDQTELEDLRVTVPAGTAANTLPAVAATMLKTWLGTARNALAWLVARFDASGNALTANSLTTARTITVDPTATAAASFQGTGNVSAGVAPNLTAGTAASTLPTAGTATALTTLLNTVRNCLAWLVARFDASGNANTANSLTTARNITVDPTATAAASFQGTGNVSAGVSVTIAAGTATNTLPTTTAQALSTWLASARNVLAWVASPNLTAGESTTLPTAGTATSLLTLLNSMRNNLTWLFARFNINSGVLRNAAYAREGFTGNAEQLALGGDQTMANSSASWSIAIGYYSQNDGTTGSDTISIGRRSFQHITSGAQSIAMGYNAGRYAGVGTGQMSHAANCTFLGFSTGAAFVAPSTNSNQMSLGNGARCTADNQITLGNASISALRCQVTTITPLSDARIKQDVELANLDKCFDAVKMLPIRRYKLNPRLMGMRRDRTVTGFVADDVEKVFPKSVATCSGVKFADDSIMHNVKELTNDQALPTLWGAVQKLIEKNEALEKEIAELKNGRSH